MKIVIDNKIIETDKVLILNTLHEKILKELPSTMWKLSDKLIKDCAQSTVSRNLHELEYHGLIYYEKIDGRTKMWKKGSKKLSEVK